MELVKRFNNRKDFDLFILEKAKLNNVYATINLERTSSSGILENIKEYVVFRNYMPFDDTEEKLRSAASSIVSGYSRVDSWQVIRM